MSDSASPYREMGLSARTTHTAPKRRKRPADFGLFHDSQRRVRREMHYWDLIRTDGGRQTNRSQLCSKCKKPRFVVEGYPCRGKK